MCLPGFAFPHPNPRAVLQVYWAVYARMHPMRDVGEGKALPSLSEGKLDTGLHYKRTAIPLLHGWQVSLLVCISRPPAFPRSHTASQSDAAGALDLAAQSRKLSERLGMSEGPDARAAALTKAAPLDVAAGALGARSEQHGGAGSHSGARGRGEAGLHGGGVGLHGGGRATRAERRSQRQRGNEGEP